MQTSGKRLSGKMLIRETSVNQPLHRNKDELKQREQPMTVTNHNNKNHNKPSR